MTEKTQTEICIVGPGAIGLYLTCELSQLGFKVNLLAKDKSLLPKNDITLSGYKNFKLQKENYNLIDYRDLPKLSALTQFWVCVKAKDLDYVLHQLKPQLKTTNSILLLQNGLAIYNQAIEVLGKLCPVLRMLIKFGVSLENNFHVHLSGRSVVDLAYLNADQNLAKSLALILKQANFEIALVDNIAKAEWEKAILNLSVNPICSILNAPNKIILDQPELKLLLAQLLEEAKKVALAEGFDFSSLTSEQIFKKIEISAPNINSHLRDLQQGKITDMDFLMGRFLRLAKAYQIQTPIFSTLNALFCSLEDSKALANISKKA